MRDDLTPVLALCAGQPGNAAEHVTVVLDPIYQGKDLNALPSVEVRSESWLAIAPQNRGRIEEVNLVPF